MHANKKIKLSHNRQNYKHHLKLNSTFLNRLSLRHNVNVLSILPSTFINFFSLLFVSRKKQMQLKSVLPTLFSRFHLYDSYFSTCNRFSYSLSLFSFFFPPLSFFFLFLFFLSFFPLLTNTEMSSHPRNVSFDTHTERQTEHRVCSFS